ncbi:hypothetical protein ABQD64_13740 [Vagococcus fluvialis]|uniref:hypothetical protein n=1 Tax=Vagococcus fluvialis TaxID=2738 RepID=UPI0032E4D936
MNKKKRKKKILVEKNEYEILYDQNLLVKFILFLIRFFKDAVKRAKDNKFNGYGLTCYVGRQGSGKTISIVSELERIRRDYPDVKIMTNFGYENEHEALNDWQQLIDCRNPEGIVFAIDEIQNEFDVYDSRNFNLEILKVITQQRKQGIKILASSQVFTRVSKPLREQCYEVVECYTVLKRWTFMKCFDADDYNAIIDNPTPDKKSKLSRKYRRNFVQSDKIRNKYDSYKVIESMKKLARNNKK